MSNVAMNTDVSMAQRSALRPAFIGGGFMAQVHSVAARAAGATPSALLSSSLPNAKAAAERLGVTQAFESLDELLSSDVDVIHICSPNATHAPYALRALEAGKHVICEKPLGTNIHEAARMTELARQLGLTATVPFVYRFHPMVREARDLVRRNMLGAVLTIQGGYMQDWLMDASNDDWRVDAELGGASRVFADIGSHLCDLIEFVTDDRIVSLSSRTRVVHPNRAHNRNVTTEDLAAVIFETAGGALGTLVVSQLAPGRKNRLTIEISGQTRSLAFDQEQPESLWLGEREGSRTILRDPLLLSADAARLSRLPAGHPQGYQDAFNAFVADSYDAILGQPADGLPTFSDGLRAVRITEAVLASARSGERVSLETESTYKISADELIA
ncbi:MAG: Gfo/Idh/MocA family oxidoreductase [Microbacteriaceae bacterium]|nr:Gfo/Idh/MocA family oxidoreductase [Microbacteriaceae bacterium]